jgi:iron complex outermembrane receptor protein
MDDCVTRPVCFFSQLKRQTGNSYTVYGEPYTVPAAFFPIQSNSFYWRDLKSHAVYSQFSYDLTKELTATLGLRYTWNTGNYKATNRLGFGYNPATNQSNPAFGPVAIGGNFFSGPCAAGLRNYFNFNAAACTGEQSLKSQAPSFTFTLEDKYSEHSMIYATMRGGYLAGGFNNQTYTPDHSGQTFKPEKVVDFETGVKSDWDLWGRPIRTNLAVFYSNYKNMQRVQNGQTTDPVSGAFVSYVAVQNAGAATAYGF